MAKHRSSKSKDAMVAAMMLAALSTAGPFAGIRSVGVAAAAKVVS